eukprot:1919222-Lingulodinium_polyedra.AAC.1
MGPPGGSAFPACGGGRARRRRGRLRGCPPATLAVQRSGRGASRHSNPNKRPKPQFPARA